jgi:hypothetical protein
MPEWWLVDAQTQRGIAMRIDDAAARILRHFDAHHDENSITAALCQELVREPILLGDTTGVFNYRNFPDPDRSSV